MKTVQSVCVLVLSVCLSWLCAYAEDSPEKRVQKAADMWLGQVDAGNYAASWKEASPYFQGKRSRGHWEKEGSVAKFDFRGKIRKPGINNLTTYRYQNSRKSNFATEHGGNPRQHVRDTYGCEAALMPWVSTPRVPR